MQQADTARKCVEGKPAAVCYMARTIKMQKGGITGRLQEQYGQS